jgi:hypothetical protein
VWSYTHTHTHTHTHTKVEWRHWCRIRRCRTSIYEVRIYDMTYTKSKQSLIITLIHQMNIYSSFLTTYHLLETEDRPQSTIWRYTEPVQCSSHLHNMVS